jgi:hypothetical protein
VGASQPLAQPIGGLARGRAIKGHERGRDFGNPDDARAPAIGRDSSDLDQVRVSADGFFEAMDRYAHGRAAACVWKVESGMNCTPASSPIKRSGGRRLVQARKIRKDASEKQLWRSGFSTGNGPVYHVFLKDGTSFVGAGEPARVSDGVVFSMPTSASVNDPQLQPVTRAPARSRRLGLDDPRRGGRTARYMVTQAGAHYARLRRKSGRRFTTSRSRPIRPDVSRSSSARARPATRQ